MTAPRPPMCAYGPELDDIARWPVDAPREHFARASGADEMSFHERGR